jgi:hypothetical protein
MLSKFVSFLPFTLLFLVFGLLGDFSLALFQWVSIMGFTFGCVWLAEWLAERGL